MPFYTKSDSLNELIIIYLTLTIVLQPHFDMLVYQVTWYLIVSWLIGLLFANRISADIFPMCKGHHHVEIRAWTMFVV